jgi:hypothetical protein
VSDWEIERVSDLAVADPPIPEGQRHAALEARAQSMREQPEDYDSEDIFWELHAINRHQCKPPLPDGEVTTMAGGPPPPAEPWQASPEDISAWHELFRVPRKPPSPEREKILAESRRQTIAALEEYDAELDRRESAQNGEREQAISAPRTEAVVRLTPISSIRARRVSWLEDDLIPRGMVTGLVAAGGTVKGLYGVLLGVRAAQRGESTLFLCSEDALEYIVKPRFLAHGCNTDLAQALWIEEPDGSRRNLRFPSELPVLRSVILEGSPSLVVIDPMASHLDSGLDMAKNNEMREILQPLISIAEESSTSIIPVYHLGKDRGRGALGSVAFEDACRCVLTAARDDVEDDVRHVEVTKSNVGPTGYGRKLRIVETLIEIDGEQVGVAKVVDEGRSPKSVPVLLERSKRPGPDPTQRELARERLAEILSERLGGTVSAAETKKKIAAELDVSESTVWRAFTELKNEELVGADALRDEVGSILEWRWYAKPALALGASEA